MNKLKCDCVVNIASGTLYEMPAICVPSPAELDGSCTVHRKEQHAHRGRQAADRGRARVEPKREYWCGSVWGQEGAATNGPAELEREGGEGKAGRHQTHRCVCGPQRLANVSSLLLSLLLAITLTAAIGLSWTWLLLAPFPFFVGIRAQDGSGMEDAI